MVICGYNVSGMDCIRDGNHVIETSWSKVLVVNERNIWDVLFTKQRIF